MVYKQSTIVEAYSILGLEQDASLEVVKSTYKQLALKTHPDKNPDDVDATAQFQRLSEAYNTLVKHLDRSSTPPHSHSHAHYHPFGYSDGDYDDEDDEDYYYDDEFEDYESDYEERMEFYRFLFEELLRGRASRYAHAQYQRNHYRHDQGPPETPEQYSARLRKAREEQEKAAERRAKEEANRKANLERERERQRREAEHRQRVKASTKRAEAEASRKAAEQKALTQQEKLQTVRSKVFASARGKDSAAVKKGVWEDSVDAAGGEIRKGSQAFAKNSPADPKETLLHIAAMNGDLDLVEWLDSHSAEPDERNGEDMTAFHVALQHRYPKIVGHFFEGYPPADDDYANIYRSPESKSNILLALDTKEPEMVWLVLDKQLYSKEEIDQAWEIIRSSEFKAALASQVKYDEFVNLFTSYGSYSAVKEPPREPESTSTAEPVPPPVSQQTDRATRQQTGKFTQSRWPRPTVNVDNVRSHTASPVSAASENPQTPLSASPSTNGSRGFRGQSYHRGSFRPHQRNQQASASPKRDDNSQLNGAPGQQPFNGHRGSGRGRGRGQFRGRGRGRGRGEVPVGATSAAA